MLRCYGNALIYGLRLLSSCGGIICDEDNGAVRGVPGHYFFVFIHPYMDGNGRLARILMNPMPVTAGYPWTIIHVTDRAEYMKSLAPAATDNA